MNFRSETVQTMLETAERIVSAHLAPVVAQGDEFLGIVTVFRDITKEAEADRAKRKFIQMEQIIREATSVWRRPIEEKGLTKETL